MAKSRTTAAQRNASRRNLAKARAAKKQRAAQEQNMKLLMALGLVVMFVVLVIASKGLILLPVAGIVLLGMLMVGRTRRMIFLALQGKTLRSVQLERARQIGELVALTPKEFEETMGGLLKEMGFAKVERVGGAGDLSVDLRGKDAAGGAFVAQCKRYAPEHKVGSPEIQQFIGMGTVHHGAQRLLYFTTSTYTAPAVDLAKRHSLELFTGADIVRVANHLCTQSQQNRSGRTGDIDVANTSSDRPQGKA
ncbi:MAG: restriction endonuclease [Actinomycetota bacterium]|nr:restriction endonuclease [Actinomycetota bacterium]